MCCFLNGGLWWMTAPSGGDQESGPVQMVQIQIQEVRLLKVIEIKNLNNMNDSTSASCSRCVQGRNWACSVSLHHRIKPAWSSAEPLRSVHGVHVWWLKARPNPDFWALAGRSGSVELRPRKDGEAWTREAEVRWMSRTIKASVQNTNPTVGGKITDPSRNV